MIRNATLDDIEQVLEVEKKMYWTGLLNLWDREAMEQMKNTFISCLENFPGGFFVVTENGKVLGFIVLELINEIKTIPYVHNSRDFHKNDGMFTYVEGFGTLKEEIALDLYKKAIEFSKSKNCEKIIVVTHHEEGHDMLEIKTLLSLGFRKEIEMTDWELYPGRIDKADIWVKKLQEM